MAYYEMGNSTFLTDNLLGSPASAKGSDIYASGVDFSSMSFPLRDNCEQ